MQGIHQEQNTAESCWSRKIIHGVVRCGLSWSKKSLCWLWFLYTEAQWNDTHNTSSASTWVILLSPRRTRCRLSERVCDRETERERDEKKKKKKKKTFGQLPVNLYKDRELRMMVNISLADKKKNKTFDYYWFCSIFNEQENVWVYTLQCFCNRSYICTVMGTHTLTLIFPTPKASNSWISSIAWVRQHIE